AELAALVRQTEAALLVFQPPPGVAPGPDPLAAVRAAREAMPGLGAVVHGCAPGPDDVALAAVLDGPPAPAGAPRVEPSPMTPDRADVLLLTSGSTGSPKAVVETLPALLGKVRLFAEELRAGPDDVHLVYLPICHAFGLKLVLTALTTGGRLVFLDRFTPDGALELVGTEGVTVVSGTPTHMTLLLRALDDRHDVSTLRWAVSAAAPLAPALVDEIYARLGCEILHVYGCSEGFLTVTSDRDEVRAGSAGHRVFRGPAGSPPDGRVAILVPGGDAEAAAGEVGEIAYGAARPVRYWGAPPVATGGWYRTGDLGRIDGHGRLFVCGRLKDVVNRGGLKVSCAEVEGALARHPAVAECAVVPAPDAVLGEAVCACLVALPDAAPPDLGALRAFAGESLARHKLPDELCVLTALPRTPVGKLDRRALLAAVVDGDLPRQRLRPDPMRVTPTPVRTTEQPRRAGVP
ncbi:MAG TPA: long-chain fatty acid--CoA ligase, partial [Candidatus Dormibacteraeota bacterium]|nr:long-chain fatty acid--CoA ligase [Candidatus Dormibacteraeota bacterium]